MKTKKITWISTLLLVVFSLNGFAADKNVEAKAKKQIYEWRIYKLKGDATLLDDFFKETLIPAYNRQKISVGAFKAFKQEETELRYLLFVYPDLETYHQVKNKVWNDKTYREKAQVFFDKTAPAPVYSDYETFICEAFDKIPVMRKPDKDRGLFEFRIYHSPNEEANQRKIKMFNAEEIDLFDKVGINSVCYGEIFAGQHMPALIYLTWYENEETREEAWKKFREHPDWNTMKNKAEYKYTATNNQAKLLSPLHFSQF